MKKTSKKLNLNIEAIRNLADVDLKHIAGGAVTENRSACQTNCHASICVCNVSIPIE
jgi:natural product precursor